jgi:hypothetical protein
MATNQNDAAKRRAAQDAAILAQLDGALRAKVLSVLAHVNAPGKLPSGLSLRPQCGYRSAAAQLAAYKAGNTKLKKGKHNLTPARACDLVWYLEGVGWLWDSGKHLEKPLPWWLIGYWAEVAGLLWGGRWGTSQASRKVPANPAIRLGWDCPHVELSGWGR